MLFGSDDVTSYHCISWFVGIKLTRNLIIPHCSFKSKNSFQIVSFVVFYRTLFVLFLKRWFSVMSIEFIKQSVFTFLLFESWYRVLTSSLRDNLRVRQTLTLHSAYICFNVLMFRPNLFFGKLRWVALPPTGKCNHLR